MLRSVFLLVLVSMIKCGEPPTKETLLNDISNDILGLNIKVGATPTNGHADSAYLLRPCNRSREIIKDSLWGRISDGPSNYTQDTTCEWLISAPKGHWISLKIDRVRTECSYDYLFIIDGISYISGKLMASFSGASDPHVNILAQSGHMLILLYSDPNYVLDGFQAEYSISTCPLNCSHAGECVQIQNEHICKCIESRSGVACQNIVHTTQSQSVLLSNESDSNSTIFDPTFKSSVLTKYLPTTNTNNVHEHENVNSENELEEPDRRIIIAAEWNSPIARVGHSLNRIGDELFIYGGFDLNKVLDSLIIYQLTNNHIKQVGNSSDFELQLELDHNQKGERVWPGGRFAHAFVHSQTGFFIHGGKTSVGEISSDLFYYNVSSSMWTKISADQISFPYLMYHSMTRTSSGWIYIFGGGTPNGEFSSQMYRFHESSPNNWTAVISSCCGKSTFRSLLGHTMTFWPAKNALILFGGVGSSDFGRFSKLSSQLWLFLLDSNMWLQLDYKKNGGVPSGIQTERAFHTAHLADHYLTIFGGYTHVHNKDESCYSNQMLVYNLECHIFLPSVPPPAAGESGHFGHQSVIFKDQILIIGGYRGYLSQVVRNISFPFSKSSLQEDCSSFDRWRCSGESKCGWCPTNLKCFPKLTGASNCTTNLQSIQCPGICPLLSSCQSCVVPGCVWCGSSEQCFKDNGRETRPCIYPGDDSITIQTTDMDCRRKSFKMGLTQFEYRFPPNFTNPDSVKIINSCDLIIPREYGSSIPSDNSVTFALRGFLIAMSKVPFKKLEMCTLQAAVNLTLFGAEENFTTTYRWTDYQLCYNLTWPSGNAVILMPGSSIRFDLIATSFGKGLSQEKPGKVTIQQKHYSGPTPQPRPLVKAGLLPFDSSGITVENTACYLYKFCLPCTGDISCAWNQNLGTCSSRFDSQKILKSNDSMILQPEDCHTCTDINFCDDCVSTRENGLQLDCEWWDEEMSCQRRGRLETAVRSKDYCSATCSTRKNCSSCLDAPGKCVWCEQNQECFVFSVYTSLYQYGQCFQWIDKGEMCKRCDKQPTCESCIMNINCGWNYNENGGACSEGDFGGPYRSIPSDSAILSTELLQDGNNKTWTWTYGECPDVNECELEIDDCHANATCVNTPGSFHCVCKQGFTGDGRSVCEQTCHEPCKHGTCSPQYFCECDLGWTGVACSIDCGCNNHSFCETGGCDECKDWTTGSNCELCAEGSFGNATVLGIGCSPCNCNDHGDRQLGLCDPITGHCYCLNNTTGRDCSECAAGFYGDPTDGKPCYQGCSGRAFMESPKGNFGLPPESTSTYFHRRQMQPRNSSLLSNIHVEHCMWIIRGTHQNINENEIPSEPTLAGLSIFIEPGFNIPCYHNVLLIYKGYSEFGVSGRTVPLVAAICSEKEETLLQSEATRVNIEGNVATVVLKYARMGSTKFSFNAKFNTITDSEQLERNSIRTVTQADENFSINISKIYEGPSLSVLSRYGHTLHVDQKNLWIFGGYSLSHGPLSDIRHFSLESESWVPLTITVVQNDESITNVPPGRYFHAGVIFHGGVIGPNRVIFIHGGISGNLTFLSDSWNFDTRHSRWSKFCDGPNQSPKLAGHTMTLRPGTAYGDSFNIVMIGGFNPEEGFSDKIYTLTGATECWTEIETIGSNPIGVYGHTTVYHEESDTFYLFGGTLHDTIGMHHVSISTSRRLFVLSWSSKKWSVLSPMDENQVGLLPNPRFLHSAVTTSNYMIVFGGISENSSGREKNSTALVYVYQCNLWLLVSGTGRKWNVVDDRGADGFENGVGRVASSIGIWKNEIFQMGGWHQGSTSESLFQFQIPNDPCGLHKSKQRCKGTIGCAFCSSNNNRSQQCYNALDDMPSSCSSGASNIEFWKGIPCSSTWMEQQGCARFNSCTECLAIWPNHPNITQGTMGTLINGHTCQWCTNGKEGRCVRKKIDEDSPCGQKQWVITDSSQCPERVCSAPQCEKCTGVPAGKCIWTRQILRSRERSWEMRLQPVYDWNCVRKSILDTSPSVAVVSSPPASCPIPCSQFDSCQECLESPGAEGGFHQCHWSVRQHRCISPAYSSLLCFGGICGPILKGTPAICPKACTTLRSCNLCLENPSCGWCAVEDENGEGLCLSANSLPETGLCSNHSKWHYLKCPRENECTNGHHGCDPKSEKCIDLEEGYRCQCREGYERSDASCIPICPDGCVHGTCKEPGNCSCNFGYIGSNCSAQCDCNGHSDCAGVDSLDVCLECKNNTMGSKCSQCKPMFVGDPRNNGQCIACLDYCNGHSSICLSYLDYNKWCNATNKHLSSSQLMSRILSSEVQMGPSTTAFCCHCKNQTTGDTCNDCNHGYFRGYDDKRLTCRKCECNGHGDTCDPITGHDCNCDNNTESEHCSQNAVKQNPHYQCWKHQCSKCRESYLGTPTNGHQCYIQMHVESYYCFDPKSQDQKCAMKQKLLTAGRTVFLAVQPKFMNVNIQVTVDVTHGSINVYLSPKDDTFVIKQDDHNWIHRVEFDTKYGLTGERKEGPFSKSTSFSIENNSNKVDPDYDLPVTANKTSEEFDEQDEVSGVNRVIPKPVGVSSASYRFTEHEAAGYATYYTVQDPKAILLVRNLRNRLVITLPQDSHDLRLTRFYLVLEGIGDVSFGSVFFRQDQLHIDLFVFFSVFFSAFFLFLAGCGVAWKVKQNMEARRARHRHVAEMLSMAKRPFAMWTLLLEPEASSGISDAYTQCRKSCRKGCICLRPLAVEWTSSATSNSVGVCTMLISMPGGSNAPVRLSIGSVLANLQRSSHAPFHGRRRRLQH